MAEPKPEEGWLPVVLCPTDGVWRMCRLPDGQEVIACFTGFARGPHARRWRTKTFSHHNPQRPTDHFRGGIEVMTAPYDTFVIADLPDGIYPTHFRPNDTVYGSPDGPPFLPHPCGGEVMAEDRYFHLECPDCEWDCVIAASSAELGLSCPICAEDNGRQVYLRTGHGEMPDRVEGFDARAALNPPRPSSDGDGK